MLLEDFNTRTAVCRKFLDVDIFDARMETQSGDSVNALIMRETYSFSYKVRFNVDLEKVHFATTFQNKKGIALSVIMLPGTDHRQTMTVARGETYLIKNEFKCLLRPGTYYINATVSFIDPDKGHVPVSEIIDFFVFIISGDGSEPFWGIVDLDQTGRIVKLPAYPA